MLKKALIIISLIAACLPVKAQQKEFTLTDSWIQKIEKLAPDKAEVKPEKHHRILVFSLFTGYNHWVVPHTNAVLKVLADKTGAFEIETSNDIFSFEKNNLRNFDAVILNNNCSVSPRRNLFMDVLDQDQNMTDDQRMKKAADFESNLLEYVSRGGGLVVIHGAIVMQNNSMAFSEMVGGSFDYHPEQQEITLELFEPGHPLVKAFEGKPFIHTDEPYLFNNAYIKRNFRPLLYMDCSKLIHKTREIEDSIRYVSWIKRYGQGRVFYVSPSHNAQSFEDPCLLKFYLDGIQYVLGDLKCDDSPLKSQKK